MDILEHINELRKERNWSIYKLAEESGLTQSTLANMFSRKSNPNFNTLSMICDAFGITLAEFFEDKNTNNSPDELVLLSNYRKLSQKEKSLVISIINNILSQNKTS